MHRVDSNSKQINVDNVVWLEVNGETFSVTKLHFIDIRTTCLFGFKIDRHEASCKRIYINHRFTARNIFVIILVT